MGDLYWAIAGVCFIVTGGWVVYRHTVSGTWMGNDDTPYGAAFLVLAGVVSAAWPVGVPIASLGYVAYRRRVKEKERQKKEKEVEELLRTEGL